MEFIGTEQEKDLIQNKISEVAFRAYCAGVNVEVDSSVQANVDGSTVREFARGLTSSIIQIDESPVQPGSPSGGLPEPVLVDFSKSASLIGVGTEVLEAVHKQESASATVREFGHTEIAKQPGQTHEDIIRQVHAELLAKGNLAAKKPVKVSASNFMLGTWNNSVIPKPRGYKY